MRVVFVALLVTMAGRGLWRCAIIGDDIHLVLVGDASRAEGATDFKIATPDPVTPTSATDQ